MKKCISIFAMMVVLFSLSYSGAPVQNMSPASLALDYSGLWRGETITTQKIGAHENAHLFSVRYAPIAYLLLSAGLGAAAYSVDTNMTDGTHKVFYNGGYGLAPSFGINAFSPYLFPKILRVTAEAKGYYLSTTEKTENYEYSGLFATGGAGLIFSIGSSVDIEVGGRGFIIVGEMQKKGDSVQAFSNNEPARGYLSITIQTPLEGGYISLDFDASPAITGEWTRGPSEASIGITAGVVLRGRTAVEKTKPIDEKNFPNYKNLEKKSENLLKELK